MDDNKTRAEFLRRLGLPTNADRAAIESALKDGFRLWNNRTNAPTLEKRTEAQQMIRLLSDAEAVLMKGQARPAPSPTASAPSPTAPAHSPTPTHPQPASPTPSNGQTVQIVCTKCGQAQPVLGTANRFVCANCKVAFRFCVCLGCRNLVRVEEAFQKWTCPYCGRAYDSAWITTTALVCVRCSTRFVFAKGTRAILCSGCKARYDRCPFCGTYNNYKIDFGARRVKCVRCHKQFVR